MINHPFITHQIAGARQRDLLDAAARHRRARDASAERPPARRPALSGLARKFAHVCGVPARSLLRESRREFGAGANDRVSSGASV
jgi:hypothetical protein